MSPFWENLSFVLWPTWILDLVDPGTCYRYFFKCCLYNCQNGIHRYTYILCDCVFQCRSCCKMHHSFSIIWSQGSIITWSFSSFLIGNITITTYSLISLWLVFAIFVHKLWDIFCPIKILFMYSKCFFYQLSLKISTISLFSLTTGLLVKNWLFGWLQEYRTQFSSSLTVSNHTNSQVIMPPNTLFGFYYCTRSIITRSWL